MPPATLVTMRVLGVRHLAQTLVDVVGPWPTVGYLGAGTDGLHALSDVGLAVAGSSVAPRRAGRHAIAAVVHGVDDPIPDPVQRSDAHVAT